MKLPIQNKLVDYFRAKQSELIALSKQAIVNHPTINGAHRELIVDSYLQDILPKRFAVGSGIVHGMINESAQSDIVIWDAHNYPSIKMQGNSLFFPESVRACIEVKSLFNATEIKDIRRKTDKLREANLGKHYHPTLKEEILRLEQQMYEINSNQEHSGMLISQDRTASVAFVFKGGENFKISDFKDEDLDLFDDEWPDLMIFLEAGKIIYKQIEEEIIEENGIEKYTVTPYIIQLRAEEDCLIFFTAKLLSLLSERVINIENYSYFEDYLIGAIEMVEEYRIIYPIIRPLPGVRFL